MKVLSASPLLVLSAKVSHLASAVTKTYLLLWAKVIFGLNALAGRTLQSGSTVGPWNSSNAESFICYTVRKNYSIAGWEFGYLIERILDPSYLDGVASTFSGLKNILQKSATKAKAWVGEAGGAYNNGHHLVSDAFVYSFWYLDQLGMSTVYDTRTYCRQSLVGGNYGLLNTSTFVPNPDYYRYQILNFIVEGCAACYCGLSHFSFQVSLLQKNILCAHFTNSHIPFYHWLRV
ncbi:heparanase-like protein 3 [Arachis ipaensis]|uniref:heparanase-like protein 3 n=1 Tax=Arachis ipaensis TaxID=130454 RepID=UPI000A2AF310|nr:heparanase-like protein 3 [Arachis ipaensis]